MDKQQEKVDSENNKRGVIARLSAAISRVSPFNQYVDEPTYTKDIVGEIKQWDECDIVFARTDLFRFFGIESPQYKEYYERHPEYLESDVKVNKPPGLGLGKTGGADTPMFESQFHTMDKISSESFVDGEPAPHKVEIPPEKASLKVKALARVLGAEIVGVGPLRQEWVYSHSARSWGDKEGFQPRGTPNDLSHHTNAIALGVAMNYDLIQNSPDFPELLATAEGYATGAWISIQLAEYIRMLGYSARAHHFHNYRVICVPVAVDCGLGELSRAGYLMTKELGLGLRLAVVTTDMPLVHDKPVDLGIQSFCETCKVCAETCPIGAIPEGDKVEYNGIKRWKLDEDKCYRYWRAAGTDCGICMAACPWTKPPTRFHKLMAALASISGPHQAFMTWADKLVYGEYKAKPRPDFIDEFKR